MLHRPVSAQAAPTLESLATQLTAALLLLLLLLQLGRGTHTRE